MPRWTLENLIDFEQALAAEVKTPASVRTAVREAAHGKDGTSARGAGLHAWLAEMRRVPAAGRKFSNALGLVAFLLGALAFLAGASGVIGLLDRTRGGMDVVLFLAILLGTQWLILIGSLCAWIFRRKVGEGFSGFQTLAGRLARKFAGGNDDGWWQRIVDGGAAPRAALLWRLARLAQGAGICFNIGIVLGLLGLVFVRNVGFFWETTTESAMRGTLVGVVNFLSSPWSALWPEAVPAPAVIDSTRWLAGRGEILEPGPAAWWMFLLMAVVVWGLLPRLLLWFLACRASAAALGKLDFQARHHRALWRELTGVERIETDEKPLDGVLVFDVGGSGLSQESLRPFLLQKLRVHPAAWHSVAVLDPGAEREAAASLAAAPAGVVLLTEGWALSPPRMIALHARIRAMAGKKTPVKFLVANEAAGQPVAPTGEERAQWEKFVDSLRDPYAEVFPFKD